MSEQENINAEQTTEAQNEMALRRERLSRLRELGIDPFGQKFVPSHSILETCQIFEKAEKEGEAAIASLGQFQIAGRMMASRGMGKAVFANLQDLSGNMQFYVREDHLSPLEFEIFSSCYVGDIFGLSGEVFRTKKNEITLRVQKLTLLCASLRPLPEKFHGMTDKELRYRRRSVDLIMNEEARKTFLVRSKMIANFRRVLDQLGFHEAETPILQPIAGGAAARPFVTFHNALKMNFYLRIATELHLKRLLVGGLEKVYEIGRLFRNEGVSQKHNPEFTTIELYQAYADYEDMMNITEELVETSAIACRQTTDIQYQEHLIHFQRPWPRLRFLEVIARYAETDESRLKSIEDVRDLIRKKNLDIDLSLPLGKLYDELFSSLVEPHLIQPTFIYEYPKELSPLAKQMSDKPDMTYRFEAFVAGMEIANAFSELNDPIDQLERFEQQMKDREAGDDEAHQTDHDYVETLEFGMPPAGGLGIGIDRLAMLLSGQNSIREVILFPHMRNK